MAIACIWRTASPTAGIHDSSRLSTHTWRGNSTIMAMVSHDEECCHVALWKHSSSWETMAMMVLFPRQVWVLKRELSWIPAVGLAVRQMHAIAIDRKAGHSAVAQVIEQGKQRLDEGDWIMIFPEGTRMAKGETRRYGVSGTLLAIETGRLIVPVAHNAGFYWPRRGVMKKPGTVRVVIGAPVATVGREARELNEQIQAWVEATVRNLEPVADRPYP